MYSVLFLQFFWSVTWLQFIFTVSVYSEAVLFFYLRGKNDHKKNRNIVSLSKNEVNGRIIFRDAEYCDNSFQLECAIEDTWSKSVYFIIFIDQHATMSYFWIVYLLYDHSLHILWKRYSIYSVNFSSLYIAIRQRTAYRRMCNFVLHYI